MKFKKRKIILGDPYLCKEFLKQKRIKKQIKDALLISLLFILILTILPWALVLGEKLNG